MLYLVVSLLEPDLENCLILTQLLKVDKKNRNGIKYCFVRKVMKMERTADHYYPPQICYVHWFISPIQSLNKSGLPNNLFLLGLSWLMQLK